MAQNKIQRLKAEYAELLALLKAEQDPRIKSILLDELEALAHQINRLASPPLLKSDRPQVLGDGVAPSTEIWKNVY
jgi:AMMECR1 domain-containing protein